MTVRKISWARNKTHCTDKTVNHNIIWLITGTGTITSTIVLYKPSASLTCSARTVCSQSINSSMRLPQVASGPFNHSLNTSWQQTLWPSEWCSALMKSTVRPSLSKSMSSPSCLHCGVRDLIISTFSPSAVLSFMSCAILGFVSA